jgi:hypothetical protein
MSHASTERALFTTPRGLAVPPQEASPAEVCFVCFIFLSFLGSLRGGHFLKMQPKLCRFFQKSHYFSGYGYTQPSQVKQNNGCDYAKVVSLVPYHTSKVQI